jgi:ribosome-associated translation inhibitor RaiA
MGCAETIYWWMDGPVRYSGIMELRLTSHGIELSDELRRFVERRARFGLGRFAARIRSMAIRLKDVNGPRGGVDQSCHVKLDLGFEKPVIISERRENAFSAVSFAMDRAARAVRRRIATARKPRSGRGSVETVRRPVARAERREDVLPAAAPPEPREDIRDLIGLAIERAALAR